MWRVAGISGTRSAAVRPGAGRAGSSASQVRYHSGWPTTAVALTQTEPIPIVSAGPRNARRLHDYRSLDIRVARRFQLSGASELTVFVEAGNILNRDNDCCVKYELESEETPELTLDTSTLRYLPITPSLGFIWRF